MTFEEVKRAVLALGEEDQKRLITEVIPAIWPRACLDDACLRRVKALVDEDAVKEYRRQNMGSI